MSENGSKSTRRTCLRVKCLPQLPGCLDIVVWWKSAQQPDTSWSMEWRIPTSLPISHTCSRHPCLWVTHVPVGYFRVFAMSPDVWDSSPSHRGLSTKLSLHLRLLFGHQSCSLHTGRGRGSSSSSKGKKAQETLASRLPCLFCFLLLPNLAVCSVAASCCLFVVEALTLKASLSLHCCHLTWPSTVFTANVSPQHASPLKLWVSWAARTKLKC